MGGNLKSDITRNDTAARLVELADQGHLDVFAERVAEVLGLGRVRHVAVQGDQVLGTGHDAVSGGQGDGLLGEVDGGHPGGRHLGGHRDGDRAGSAAQVDDDRFGPGGRHPGGLLDGDSGDHLGLRARHEHAGLHRERQVAEPGAPDQVLQRLATPAALDQLGEPRREVGGKLGRQHEVDAVAAEHVRRQRERVVPRGGDAGL